MKKIREEIFTNVRKLVLLLFFIASVTSCDDESYHSPCNEISGCPIELSLLEPTDVLEVSEKEYHVGLNSDYVDSLGYTRIIKQSNELGSMNDYIEYYNVCSCLTYAEICASWRFKDVFDGEKKARLRSEYARRTKACAEQRALGFWGDPPAREEPSVIIDGGDEEATEDDGTEEEVEEDDGEDSCRRFEMNTLCDEALSVCFFEDEIVLSTSCSDVEQIVVFINSQDMYKEYRYLRFVYDTSRPSITIYRNELPKGYQKNIVLSITPINAYEILSDVIEIYE